ncbi:LD-carboxypeptidase [Kribbella sp. NBC_01245]|uniref:S66 peptidase family protein n=1 Tax=Kribbella sp. NBC_01245 TaxID=2903578 RepID=UPI002E288252|nr:LD-carboxypeptidase [Kribbella sp. NBC_01245]
MGDLKKPARLKVGDRVAVVATSGPVKEERLEVGLTILREWGLDPILMPSVYAQNESFPYLAGDDATRAKEFREAWLDPQYKAVLCARGGVGAHRMLQHLDAVELTAAPAKILLGFSDITALHELFLADGFVTVHGPMVGAVEQLQVEASRERLRALLFEPDSIPDLLVSPGEEKTRVRTLVPGRAEGRLLGGNLAVIAASFGTATALSPDGAIVVLEDVGEEVYRLDRLFTHLIRAGWFDQVAGLVLGDFTEAEGPGLVEDLLRERLVPLGIPAVENAPIGHGDLNLAVPLGARVVLDATAGTLIMPESPFI